MHDPYTKWDIFPQGITSYLALPPHSHHPPLGHLSAATIYLALMALN